MKILVNGKSFEVNILDTSHDKILFTTGGKSYLVEQETSAPSTRNQLAPKINKQTFQKSPTLKSSDGTIEILAPIPGLVARIIKKEGEEVEQGETILILEAMKMQNRVNSPDKGVISRINIQEGEEVRDGQVLLEIKRSSQD